MKSVIFSADWIVDALLGTGAHGEPRPPFDSAIDWMNVKHAKKLAVDVPSGLDCDSGEPAKHTVSRRSYVHVRSDEDWFYAAGGEAVRGRSSRLRYRRAGGSHVAVRRRKNNPRRIDGA